MLSLSVKTKPERGNDGREKKRIKLTVEEMTVDEVNLKKLIDMPDEILMTIIKFTYPAYQMNDKDFKKLNRLRRVDKKFNRLVDDIIWYMNFLPPMLLENIVVGDLEKDVYFQRMTEWIDDIINFKKLIEREKMSPIIIAFFDG